ncbi:hypothetical protein GCM10009595_15090 [Falsarthrobacter nasiphocae]
MPRPFEASERASALPLGPSGEPWPVWAGGEYTGLRSELMLAFKGRGVTAVSDVLASHLGAAVAALDLGERDVLVRVPPSWRSCLTRGYDPVERLLAGAGGAGERGLVRRRAAWRPAARGGQKGLGARQRGERLARAFRPGPRAGAVLPRCGRVVVVDDVLTTGATLGAVMKVLLAAGAPAVAGAVALAARPTGRAGEGTLGEPLGKDG